MLPNMPEAGVIASLIQHPGETLELIAEAGITAAHFGESKNRIMFEKLLELSDKGELTETAGEKGAQWKLSECMPKDLRAAPYEVTDPFPSVVPAEWIRQLSGAHIKAEKARAYETYKTQMDTPGTDEDLAYQAYQKTLDDLKAKQLSSPGGGTVDRGETMQSALNRVIDELDNPSSSLLTAWPALNESLGGLRRGALYVLAANTGIGKTTVSLDLASGVANQGHQVAVFSFEMSNNEMAKKAAASLTGISHTKIDRGELTNEEKTELKLAASVLGENLFLGHAPGRTIEQLRAAINKRNRDNQKEGLEKVSLVVVDYLQQMSAKSSSLYEKVTIITNELKQLAQDLDIPILALAQLNRAKKDHQIPELQDLRDSGSIEQDADAVLMLYRPTPSNLELVIAKNRHGVTGMLSLRVDFSRSKISSLEKI